MKYIPVILFGVGGVGRTLLEQIIASRKHLAAQNNIAFDIVAIADSKQWLFDPVGMGDDRLRQVVEAKSNGKSLGGVVRPDPLTMINQVHAKGIEGAIVVDVTAVDGMEPAFDQALEVGYSLALANKKAMAGPWSTAQKYYNNPRVRGESTVGGGEPVIASLRYLSDINDEFHRLEGQLSGTLGFICQQLDTGRPFSDALKEAKEKGFTEPDPREDLSGEDVMRKVLIMGRMAGWPLEADDIQVESLYDESLSGLSVDDFMAAAGQMDSGFASRVSEAQAEGNNLRYVGRVTKDGGKVGLVPISQESPLANLKFIRFQTKLYDAEPLLLAGAGAGLGMTAGGVLGDMISLVREVH